MSKAYEIFDEAFLKPRDPRSDEYRHGVIDILKFRLREANEASGKHQYKLGTAQADAYFAGCDEGHRLAREYLEKVGAGGTAPNAIWAREDDSGMDERLLPSEAPDGA